MDLFLIILLVSSGYCLTLAKVSVQHKVKCSAREMQVEMILPEHVTDIYLEGMKESGKELGCQPTLEGNTATFHLSLVNIYQCGITKVVDKSNGVIVYYQRIVVEDDVDQPTKEVILVKCSFTPRHRNDSRVSDEGSRHTVTRLKRQDLTDIQEEDYEQLDIQLVTGRAPVPVLGIAVTQNGNVIGSNLNVQPGTLLQMEIYLDPASNSTYGLRVAYMDVTDNRAKTETIIHNGCSVDPYLFENFNTVDGKAVTARFRAFKFPESNFVLFNGTIDVCLNKCSGVECSNDQIGYGRKRRAVTNDGQPKWRSDRIFEVTMSTLFKIDADSNALLARDVLGSKSKEQADLSSVQAKAMTVLEDPKPGHQSHSLLEHSQPEPVPEPEAHAEPESELKAKDAATSQSDYPNFMNSNIRWSSGVVFAVPCSLINVCVVLAVWLSL